MLMIFAERGNKKQVRSHRVLCLIFFSLILSMIDMDSYGGEIHEPQKKQAVLRMYARYKSAFPEVKDISVKQAVELQEQGRVVFVDIREPAEMAVSMLPGAVSRQDFLSHRDRYQDKTAVGYCTISYRSGLFAREMAAQGIAVINLRGGLLAWILEGGAVYDESGRPVKRVHVYDDRWDYAPDDYESVKFSFWESIF